MEETGRGMVESDASDSVLRRRVARPEAERDHGEAGEDGRRQHHADGLGRQHGPQHVRRGLPRRSKRIERDRSKSKPRGDNLSRVGTPSPRSFTRPVSGKAPSATPKDRRSRQSRSGSGMRTRDTYYRKSYTAGLGQ